jgi:hypothetical protein
LPQSEKAENCLLISRRVPTYIHEDSSIGANEIRSNSSSCGGDEKKFWWRRRVIEFVNNFLSALLVCPSINAEEVFLLLPRITQKEIETISFSEVLFKCLI